MSTLVDGEDADIQAGAKIDEMVLPARATARPHQNLVESAQPVPETGVASTIQPGNVLDETKPLHTCGIWTGSAV
jgi:hypothetical protein